MERFVAQAWPQFLKITYSQQPRLPSARWDVPGRQAPADLAEAEDICVELGAARSSNSYARRIDADRPARNRRLVSHGERGPDISCAILRTRPSRFSTSFAALDPQTLGVCVTCFSAIAPALVVRIREGQLGETSPAHRVLPLAVPPYSCNRQSFVEPTNCRGEQYYRPSHRSWHIHCSTEQTIERTCALKRRDIDRRNAKSPRGGSDGELSRAAGHLNCRWRGAWSYNTRPTAGRASSACTIARGKFRSSTRPDVFAFGGERGASDAVRGRRAIQWGSGYAWTRVSPARRFGGRSASRDRRRAGSGTSSARIADALRRFLRHIAKGHEAGAKPETIV